MVMTYAFLAVLGLMAVLATFAIASPLRSGSPRLFVALMAAVPVLAIGLYLVVGNPAALDREALQRLADGPRSLDEAIAGLRDELERNPAQADGWVLLGRSYAMQGRFAEARDAFARALMLVPDDANLLIEAAEARAQSNAGNRFDHE
jgi:cytochrome c-type biogenesis protein CcmH